jgi:hypothetical protein
VFTRAKGEANMLDDIKLSAFSPANTGKPGSAARPLLPGNSQGPAADVTLTPQLGKLAADEAPCPKRAEKIASLKTLLNNDEYKLDMSTLAKRLSQCSLLR